MDDNQPQALNKPQNNTNLPSDPNLSSAGQIQTSQAGDAFDRSTAPSDVKQQVSGSSQKQPAAPIAGKEEKEAGGGYYKETEPIILEKKEFKLPKEVKGWVKEEQKEETTLLKTIRDEFGQILLKAALPSKPKIVLPLTRDQTKLALKKKIVESVRWLAEWCLRILKMFPKRTEYKGMTNN